MCGLIALCSAQGAWDHEGLERGCEAMRNRGPDGAGAWWSHDNRIGLGHLRLSILDLDSRANQPMSTPDGRFVIVFNGEIYNFQTLRRELIEQGVRFNTCSDTEVILQLFVRDGEDFLPRLRGMFALAIWDNLEERLFMARDPYGIKPLYYACTGKGVLVASQVKALLATGLVSHDPDAHGQAGFWMLGSVPEPHTWNREIRALPAGHCAWIKTGRLKQVRCWWDVSAFWREAPADVLSDQEVRELVRTALRNSVAAHLVSDVPVGVFLSGGIDSGALAGLMVEAGARNLQGVTIAFREFAGRHEDETPLAAQVARHYGITHHVRMVTREEFVADLPRILEAMDQPSIDGINTWYASKAVAELGLKVVVSGVGGDELFQGYDHFRQLPGLVRWWRLASHAPGAMTLAQWIADWKARRSSNARWSVAPELAKSLAGAWWLRRGLYCPTELTPLMGEELARCGLANFAPNDWVASKSGVLAADLRLALSQIESSTYLRNQLLRDSDWASMDHSVELRTPLVDAWLLRDLSRRCTCCIAFKRNSCWLKHRQILYQHLLYRAEKLDSEYLFKLG